MGPAAVTAGRPIDHVVIAVTDLDRTACLYEDLGFTLTPRAQHPWGTANRLAQFRGRNFIELLEIDRRDLIFEHAPGEASPRFSFGAFNRDFLADGEGFSMLVLAGQDSRADVAQFRRAGLETYVPFDFERQARQPDGTEARVAFSLAFASLPDCPRIGLFTCHHETPETFWKPAFQHHRNGAEAIVGAVLVAPEPEALAEPLAAFSGGTATIAGGATVTCGPHQVHILRPDIYEKQVGFPAPDLARGPRFAALVIVTTVGARRVVPPTEAGGTAFILEPSGRS